MFLLRYFTDLYVWSGFYGEGFSTMICSHSAASTFMRSGTTVGVPVRPKRCRLVLKSAALHTVALDPDWEVSTYFWPVRVVCWSWVARWCLKLWPEPSQTWSLVKEPGGGLDCWRQQEFTSVVPLRNYTLVCTSGSPLLEFLSHEKTSFVFDIGVFELRANQKSMTGIVNSSALCLCVFSLCFSWTLRWVFHRRPAWERLSSNQTEHLYRRLERKHSGYAEWLTVDETAIRLYLLDASLNVICPWQAAPKYDRSCHKNLILIDAAIFQEGVWPCCLAVIFHLAPQCYSDLLESISRTVQTCELPAKVNYTAWDFPFKVPFLDILW